MEEITLLIVDDEEAARATLRMVNWAAHGYRLVGEAENGRQALAMIEAYRPDIALVDIVMPGISGLDLIPEMKRIHPQMQIVLVTMHRDFEYAREALRLGAREYLLKGAFGEMELLRVLEQTKGALWDARKRQTIGEADAVQNQTDAFGRFLSHGGELSLALQYPFSGMMVSISWPQAHSLLLRLSYESKILRALGPFATRVAVRQGDWLLQYPPDALPQDVAGKLARQEAEQEGLMVTASLPFTAANPKALREAVILALSTFDQRFYHADMRVVHEAFVQTIDPATGHLLQRGFQQFWRNEADNPDFLQELLSTCAQKRIAPELFRQMLAGWQKTVEKEFFKYNPSISNQLLRARTAREALQVLRSFLVASRMERASGGRLEVNQALAYIRGHLSETLAVESLAAYVGLSTNHFSVVFKGQTGENVHEHVVRLRMERAGELLLSSNMKVYEVAAAVGMPNVRYFTRAFTRFYGTQPSAYREGAHA